MTLAAFSLELDKLIEPKKGTKRTKLGCQAKARLVWKEDIRKQLLDQTGGQMSSLHTLSCRAPRKCDSNRDPESFEGKQCRYSEGAPPGKVNSFRTRDRWWSKFLQLCAPICRLLTGYVVRGAVVSVPRYTSGQRTATAEELLARKDWVDGWEIIAFEGKGSRIFRLAAKLKDEKSQTILEGDIFLSEG